MSQLCVPHQNLDMRPKIKFDNLTDRLIVYHALSECILSHSRSYTKLTKTHPIYHLSRLHLRLLKAKSWDDLWQKVVLATQFFYIASSILLPCIPMFLRAIGKFSWLYSATANLEHCGLCQRCPKITTPSLPIKLGGRTSLIFHFGTSCCRCV